MTSGLWFKRRTRKRREYGTTTEEVMMSRGKWTLPRVNNEPLSSGSRTGETKRLGYFRKTEVQVPMRVFYFCEVQQWLAPKTLHGCHCRPLVFLHVHSSEVAYQVLFTHPAIQPLNRYSSSRFYQTLLLISSFLPSRGNSGTLCIFQRLWLVSQNPDFYIGGELHRKSGKLQSSRILRAGWGNSSELGL